MSQPVAHVAPSVSALVAVAAEDLRRAGIYVICLVLAISVHEFSHAFAAHRLGDPTPERDGRLTLNPVAHADPIGTLVLPLVLGLSSAGVFFGWGRPVMTNPRFYTRKISMRGGMALVAFAGPLSNLLLATLTLGVVWGLGAGGLLDGHLAIFKLLRTFYLLNVILFVFNLLPVHPLDGGKVLAWMLKSKHQYIDDFLVRNGGYILVGLIIVGPLLGVDILGFLFGPFIRLANMALAAVV